MPLGQIEDHTFFTQFLGSESIVLDLGANRGAFSRGIIERFNARCFAVEANPELASSIRAHPNLTVLSMAVGPESGMVPFYLASHDEMSSLRSSLGVVYPKSVLVKVMRVDELVAELNLSKIDLLKIDIEGSEIDILTNCPDDFLTNIPQITVEFHDFNGLVTREAVEKVVDRLQKLNFVPIKM